LDSQVSLVMNCEYFIIPPQCKTLITTLNFSLFEMIKLKLNLFQNIQINEEVNGRRLLHYAADYGQSEVVKYLISRGADVNVSELEFSLENYSISLSC
jgi:ankyrin repeat protein